LSMDSDLNESTSLWWRFSATNDWTIDPHHKREMKWDSTHK